MKDFGPEGDAGLERKIRASLDAASGLFRSTADACGCQIGQAAIEVAEALGGGGKVLLCGNGGSAADAQHVATEMTVKMSKVRSPMAAIALTTNSSLLTAQANDLGFDTVFSRQIESLGKAGDVLIAISTSGMSPNVLRAAAAARRLGMKVIGLTGSGGGELAALSDVAVVVPSSSVARLQEMHIAVCHIICEYAEARLFGE
jgi:D-sedoheptulose 7-phosphate isomerase